MYKTEETLVSVRSSELFVDISSREIKQMLFQARTLEFAPGEVIYLADDPITQVLLLIQGLAKISQPTTGGQEVILRLCVPGEIISEPTLSFERAHSSTAVAVAHCKVLAWEPASFQALVDCFPDVRRNAQRILQCRVDELSQRLFEGLTKGASARLAINLVRLANRIGKCVGDHIEVGISREMLSQMTGMALSSVRRLLSTWREQRIVKLRREMIEIHSLPQLLSCANSIQHYRRVAGPEEERFSSGVVMM